MQMLPHALASRISLLGYEQFCDMAEQISFDQTNTRTSFKSGAGVCACVTIIDI